MIWALCVAFVFTLVSFVTRDVLLRWRAVTVQKALAEQNDKIATLYANMEVLRKEFKDALGKQQTAINLGMSRRA